MGKYKITSENNQQNIGIYVHIPFCVQKCNYCDFLSMPATDLVKQEYVRALCEEIEEKAREAGNPIVDTIYIGGGTPTVLEPKYIHTILDTIHETFQVRHMSEITLEANPGTVRRDGMEIFKKAGVNRLSMGLQTADASLLRQLGRIHTIDDYVNAVQMARSAGIDNISTDVMFSLPGQTLDMVNHTLDLLFQQEVQHISAYGLIIEEGTSFYQWVQSGRMSEVDEELDREMYHTIVEQCERKGYRQYEISNFAIQSYESRHNIRYWTMQEYIGVGLGASGFMNGIRYANVKELGEYMNRSPKEKQDVGSVQKLTREMQMEESMFLGLRMAAGVSKKEFDSRYGVGIEELFKEQLYKLKSEGLIKEKNGSLSLTAKGIDVSNYVMINFLF